MTEIIIRTFNGSISYEVPHATASTFADKPPIYKFPRVVACQEGTSSCDNCLLNGGFLRIPDSVTPDGFGVRCNADAAAERGNTLDIREFTGIGLPTGKCPRGLEPKIA